MGGTEDLDGVPVGTVSHSSNSASGSTSDAEESGRITAESFSAYSEPVGESIMPKNLQSVESYELLGFDHETATSLWDRYSKDSADTNADFFNYAALQIEAPHLEDAQVESDDWDGLMIAIGVKERLRKAILLPEFADIRFTATCKFWVLDTMEVQWEALVGMHEEMKEAHQEHAETTPKVRGHPEAVS